MTKTIELNEIRKFGNLELLARQLVEGFITGLHKSPYHGFSVEFAEHKLYNQGESIRNIDWKLYARTDRMYVKRFEEETNLRAVVLLDISGSMYYPKETSGKLTFSIMACAALLYLLHCQRDAFGLTTFSDEIISSFDPKSSTLQLKTIFSHLENLLSSGPVFKKSSVTQTIHTIADKIHKRSLVILFTDMFDNTENSNDIFNALQHLKHNKHEVILFHVRDKKTEELFEFEDHPYRFIDLESNEELRIQTHQVKNEYVQLMNEFTKSLKIKSAQYQIDYIDADIQEGYEQILLPYLVKRTKLG